jgi:hypothetical protein
MGEVERTRQEEKHQGTTVTDERTGDRAGVIARPRAPRRNLRKEKIGIDASLIQGRWTYLRLVVIWGSVEYGTDVRVHQISLQIRSTELEPGMWPSRKSYY